MIICVGGGLIICEVEWGCVGVTPSANRNSYGVAISFYILTQGRGASPLNPGLGNRNSYRVAAADGLSNGPYLEFYIVAGTHPSSSYRVAVGMG